MHISARGHPRPVLDPGPPVADDPPEEHEHAAEREAAAVHERLEVRLRPRRQVVPAVLSVGLDLLSAILSFPPPIFLLKFFSSSPSFSSSYRKARTYLREMSTEKPTRPLPLQPCFSPLPVKRIATLTSSSSVASMSFTSSSLLHKASEPVRISSISSYSF